MHLIFTLTVNLVNIVNIIIMIITNHYIFWSNFFNYNNWLVTVKIDGINITYNSKQYLTDKSSIRYNSIHKYIGVINNVLHTINDPNISYLEMEYVNTHNTVFIFNCITNNKHNVVVNDRSDNDLNIFIDQYYKLFKSSSDKSDEFDELDDDSKINIIYKPYFKITNKLNDLIKLISLLNDPKLNSFADGFILTNFEHNINLKLKPINKLSIDEYNSSV